MNERIACEIEVMSNEAQDFLLKSFEKHLHQLYITCKPQLESLEQAAQIEHLKTQSQDTLISHILLQNIGVNCE
jgi:lipid II:glycine glycyltransferase (peptidoglycan interpeptide bridge formation enzyme)